MQVRKFEARSMKEAIEMVKREMGPDAIILGARDHRKKFGLVGEGSVEITAAVANETLHRKKYSESRMRPEVRERLQNAPAKKQKEVFEKFVDSYQASQLPPVRRYIDIADEFANEAPPVEVSVKPAESEVRSDKEVLNLQKQVENLQKTISDFKKIPQTLTGSGFPGSELGLPFETSHAFEKLISAGFSEEKVFELLKNVQKSLDPLQMRNRSLVDAVLAKMILKTTTIASPDEKNSSIQIFCGPTGSGKTTALVKWAAHLIVHRQQRVAILTADTQRIGAVDQMRMFAQILNVPFSQVRKASDWTYLVQQLSDYDVILCDMPGAQLKTLEEISVYKSLLPPAHLQHQSHLVLSAATKYQDLLEAAKRFQAARPTDLIFTNLDSTGVHGQMYCLNQSLKLPLHSFGLGTRIPEDLELATPERVLDLIFHLTHASKESFL